MLFRKRQIHLKLLQQHIFNFLVSYFICFNGLGVRGDVPLSPLTRLRTIHECHKSSSSLKMECPIGHRIRILESFYGRAADQQRDYCAQGFKEKDCKSYTSFQNACNGRATCSVHFFQAFLSECKGNSNYLTVLYECVPESKVHGVCTNSEDFSSWGTLRTTDFPQPFSPNEDCWCKLVADNNQRIVLSVISFQLFPFDPTCSEAGLYLQSDRRRSKECTFLQQGHYYISSSKNLYLNFFSQKPVARGGFWIIYEASDAKSKIRLKCGDTDEVRPADFTRYSTLKQTFTPHIYEMAASTHIPKFNVSVQEKENGISEESSSEYYDDYEDEVEKIITATLPTTIMSTTTASTRPITNTFNLLNRRTTKAEEEFTFTKKTPLLFTTREQHFYYFSKTFPPKYEYFFSTKDFKRTTSLTPKTEKVLTSSKEEPSVLTEISPSALSTRKPHHKKTVVSTKPSTTATYLQTATTTIKITNKIANLSEIFSVKPKTNPMTGPRQTISKEKPHKLIATYAKTTTNTLTSSISPTNKITTTKAIVRNSTSSKANTSPNIKLTHYIASTTEAKLELSSPFSVIDLNGYMTDDMNGAQKVNQPIFVETSTKIIEAYDAATTTTTKENLNATQFMSAVGLQDNQMNNKKKYLRQSPERKLTKTELTIIISCVLFITLLTFINLIIYALRKLVKKSNQKVAEMNTNDPGKKSYDILPGVGEIVLWAAKDKRGYLIDINGSWAKIDGQRWIRENMAVLHNTYKKASMAYRNRFKKKDDKKAVSKEDSRLIKRPPPTNGTYTLPTVPEAAEYETTDNTSSSSTLQEEVNNIESEYHVEHGRVFSSAVSSNSFYQMLNSIDGPMSDIKKNSIQFEKANMNGTLIYSENNYSGIKYERGNKEIMSDISDSNYYVENNEPYAQPDHYCTSPYNQQLDSSGNSNSYPPMLHAETGSSDTDTDSAPVIKRPILIRGDNEFLKNFPRSFINEESLSTYYSERQPIDLYHAEQSLHQSANEFFQEIEISKSLQSKEKTNVQKIIEKTEPHPHFRHARTIAQPLQRSSTDVILPDSVPKNKNKNGVKLDPSILKFSNQPVAIVAPSKSNTNTLEKKKHKTEEIPTLSSRTSQLCEINQNEKQSNIYKNTKNIASNITSNISNKISQLKQSATTSVNSKFINNHNTSPNKKQYDETPIKFKTQQFFVPKSSNPIPVCSENNRLNGAKETRNTSDGSSNSSSGLSDISSLANSSDLNSSNTQKLNLLNSSRINSSNNTSNSYPSTQQITENSNKSNNMVSKLKLDYLQKQHRDSGFIDDKCLSSLNAVNDQVDEASDEQYGRPPGPLIYSQDGYFVLEHQMKTAILPEEFADDANSENVDNVRLNNMNRPANVPFSIMKSSKGQQIKQASDKNSARTVSFGNVEENAISPRNANNNNNSTVTFNNDESGCWMTQKEIKLPNDFYKMPYFKTNESGQILNDTEKISSSPHNSFSKNDSNIEKNDSEDSIASVSAMSHSNSENNSSRKFADALHKASLIEDIITRRNKAPTTTQSSNSIGNNIVNESKSEKNDEELTKRQITEIECLPHPLNLTPSSTGSYSFTNKQIEENDEGKTAYSCNGNDFNSAEFQFFINAIEKLKATNLFQEEDLKKMTDEQIYEALIEHARTQRYKFGMSQSQNKIPLNQQQQHQSAYNHSLLESIDKEQEEDLPIIMRNLHSVKSLKHFFEIRAKSNAHNINNSTVQSPLLHAKNNSFEDKETKSNVLQDLFVKNSQIIEKSVKHGIGTVVVQENGQASQHEEIPADFVYNEPILIEEVNNGDIDDQKANNINAETSHEQNVRPLPPPLPDFLLQPPPQINIKARTQSSSNITNENNYGSGNDLHDKLIKEIHNKSLERSKKDAAICLDERGNLIVKPSNRTFNSSQKNQKLHKIKDSSYSSCSNYNSIKSVNGANSGVIAEKISLLTNSNEKPSVKGKNYIKNRPHVPSSVHNQIYQERSEILSKLESIMQQKDSTINSRFKKLSYTEKNEHSLDNEYKLAAETTTTILSSNSQFYDQLGQSHNNNDSSYIPPAPPLPIEPNQSSNETVFKSYDLTSSQSEIKDASIVITKSFLINSHTEILTESPKFENEITKKLKNLNVIKKSFENSDAPKQIDENDNVNELISISQIPSVIQTLDRQKCDAYSNQIKNPILLNDPRRMTSFRSDFSTNSIGSNVSTRSMLSEAKAKLEALSGKMTSIKQTNYSNENMNNGTSYLDINKNTFENFNSNNLNSNIKNQEIEMGYEGDQSDYIQTKF